MGGAAAPSVPNMTVTLITGANKGIGFETAKQLLELGHTVYIGARDVERGENAAAALGARFVQLDVTDDASVSSGLAAIDAAEGQLDVLVHILETGLDGPAALRSFDTNAVGIVRVTEAALPLLRAPADQVQRPGAGHHRHRHDRRVRDRTAGRGERPSRRASGDLGR
jgi:NAD(P)-dependent dehydrogenase (short-subunit alcohol dehydrogenase family)